MIKNNDKKRVAVFASGSGTNFQKIVDFFKDDKTIVIDSMFCNNPDAYVIERAKNSNIYSFVFSKADLLKSNIVLNKLKSRNVDFIVLAGFLLLIPIEIINQYPNKILNIHPALLPKYGGKGMYGDNVHKAVINSGEKESGITIHFVNEKYDQGDIIFQKRCSISADDTPEKLASKIHALEHKFYPEIIQKIINSEKV